MKNSERKYFGIADIAVVLIVVIASLFALISQFNSDDNSLNCVVRYNGETIYTVSLDSVTDTINKEIVGDTALTVVISNDSVSVKSSSCPDKLCEHTGEITKDGQSIVCLPAKISVALESSDNELDTVVG